MLNHQRSARGAIIIAALLLTLSACEKPEGPAQRAGKEVDKATENAGHQIEKIGQDVQDAAKGKK